MHRPVPPVYLLAALWMCITQSAFAQPLTRADIETIRQAARTTLARDSLPGLQIAVARGDDVWSEGFGSADLEQNVAVDRYSMFRTASISKWLTATAANRLAEAGKLDLDAPVQNYCTQFPRKQATITPRLVLTHLSGIRHYHGANGEPRRTEEERNALEERRRREQATQYTRFTDVIEPLNAFKDDPLVHSPGTQLLYSSLGYRLMACVLEGAAQRTYQELTRELVFGPAKMTAITADDALAIIPHRVAGYSRSAQGALLRARFRDVSENLSAGGHLSTSEDLVRFAMAFNSDALVSAETRARMIEHPKLVDGNDSQSAPPFFGLGTSAYYGMGVFVGKVNAAIFVAHTGNQNGTSTELLLIPEFDLAIAIMTNVDGWTGTHALATQVAAIVHSQPE
jgi:CubicO group peptidase (beta-lactamase class C family)